MTCWDAGILFVASVSVLWNLNPPLEQKNKKISPNPNNRPQQTEIDTVSINDIMIRQDFILSLNIISYPVLKYFNDQLIRAFNAEI